MKHPKGALGTLIIAAGVLAGVLSQYELFSVYLRVLAGLAIFVPLTLIIGAISLVRICLKKRIGAILRYSLVVGGSSIIALVAWFVTGSLIDNWKVKAVLSYVSRAAPLLDHIREQTGSYPSELPVSLLGEPPELFRLYGDYRSTGQTFRFEYVDEPGGWAGGEGLLEFDSTTRKWISDRG